MLFLRTDYPRDRWAEPSLNDIAKHWLQMHAGFRRHQAHMDELVLQWRADRLGVVERNVVRLGLFELERGEVPVEVAVDEAVSLAKRYASEDAGRLVNGILGRVIREAGKR